MVPELDRLNQFVRTLARRERALVLARVGLQVVLLLSVVLMTLSIAAAWGWERATTAGVLVFVLGVGAWLAAAVPMLRRWPGHADPLRQARLVESMDPALRGRLVTSVAAANGLEVGSSPDLVSFVAARAYKRIADVEPARVHPLGSVQWLAASAAGAVVIALLSTLGVRGGPIGLYRYWQAPVDTVPVATSGSNLDGLAAARVGDIVLRYNYPDYTGLEPLTVPNSTGEAHGPPGTTVTVTLRSADPVQSAGLVAYDAPALEAQLVDERTVSATFTITTEPGTWQVVLVGDGEQRSSDAFDIVPELDAAPTITVEGEDRYELAIDGGIDLPWIARDDYGLVRVTVEVDGAEVLLVAEPSEPVSQRAGRTSIRPLDLGLVEGDSVDVSIVGWDNDTFTGSKAGRSRPIRIEVLGQGARDRRRTERLSKLADAMLTVLADHLEEPWPVADTSGGLARWGETLNERYMPINDLIDEYWDDVPEWAADRPLVEAVVDTARELIRYTQVSYVPGSQDIPPDASFVTTSELRDDAVSALEEAILFLDTIRDAAAYAEVMRGIEDAQELASRLSEMMGQEDIEPLAMASQLDELEATLQQLMQQLAKMQNGPLRELLNQRTQELTSLLEQARQALAEGNQEDAQELMERIARNLQQMAESVQEQLARQQQGDQQSMEQAQALRDELERLEREQRSLQAEVQQLREQSDEQRFEESQALWEQLKELTVAASSKAGLYQQGLDDASRSFNERERAASLTETVGQLDQAADARDLRGAVQEAQRARMGLGSSQMAFRMETRSRGRLAGPGERELGAMQADLDAIDRLLEQMMRNDQSGGAEQSQQMQDLAERQEQLEQETQAAQEQMEQLGQESQIQPQDAGESLSEAGERMQQAQQGLQQGQSMSAEGSQGAAAQRIAEAREALEQAMQQASERRRQQNGEGQGGQGRSRPGGQGEDPGGQGDNGQEPGNSPNSARKIEIPGPESFRTPEEYRRALLEGMEGEVPEEYRALKRRYYEELVNQ